VVGVGVDVSSMGVSVDVRRGEVEKWKTCTKVSDGSE
jgi:hypothetical protein